MPGIQGGPLMHVIAGKAVAFKEALEPEFKVYQENIVANAKALGDELKKKNYKLVSGGTDTHLLLVSFLGQADINGKKVEAALDKAGITVNKNTVPFDTEKPFVTSGIRIGTPAITTRGMGKREMPVIADFIDRAIRNSTHEQALAMIADEVAEFCVRFPIYAGRLQEVE
jgi:glycine hydroxymethyltransferase